MEPVITLLVLALIVVLAFWIVDMLPFPPPAPLIIKCIIGVIVLIKLLGLVGIGVHV